ncbi:class I SAM-dependent methyltransferase [Halorubellus sp. JP-L1]|uniref:class I SAM-dependent methyltransferase n=1 Tax=Halorubellus sp. JP-L1 TaxID=2715753 RepID=UPI00140B371F|nr:class I SAM-dependent methyltransferase [Halorubellus sp. JP-L1]NHN41020.1 class I SAM-dependent methyltransferase [Halorubellus sp. JP-L1]
MADLDPREYYTENAEREFDRLTETLPKRLEWEHTVAALEDALPDGGRVLDAGGGPGRYSIWLADRGHDVVHCDLTPELVALAREKTADAGVADRVDSQVGDVRDLPYEADAFDAVCCLGGVLSHVLDERERERAVAELHRVARPGAPVAVSVIGRVGGVRRALKSLGEADDPHPGRSEVLEHYARTGDFTEGVLERFDLGDGWAENHAFRVAELESLLEAGGLDPERVVALEGPTAALHEELADPLEHVADAARAVAAEFRDDRALADVSEHFLVLTRA